MPATSKQPTQMKSTNLYIILALITLLALGAAGIISKNLFASIVLDTKVISAKSVASKQLDQDLQAAPQLVDAYNALGTEQKTLADALPLYPDYPDLLVAIENIGNNVGISVKSISPNDSGASTPLGSSGGANGGSLGGTSAVAVPVSISVEGTYTSLTKMLAQMELSARPMRVSDIQLSGTGSDITGTIDINTYYEPAATLPFSTETIR